MTVTHTAEQNASILAGIIAVPPKHALLEAAVCVSTHRSDHPEQEIKRTQKLVSEKYKTNHGLSIVNKDSHKVLSHVVHNRTYLTIYLTTYVQR